MEHLNANRRKVWWARLVGLVALFSVLLPGAAAAQGTAVLVGTVTDAATKQPVPDVVVTATSPALQGEQMVVTDGSGTYRIPNLPPGVYAIRLEKEAFRPFARGDIGLRSDATTRVNVQLLPEAIKGEEITVVGRAPTVDVGSSATGTNISSDFTRTIPVSRPGSKGSASRSFESVAEVAPGAYSDTYGVSINGTTSPENQYVIDGVSVNNTAYGTVGTPLTVEFVKEINIISGGYMPEYGRATGGILNVVTKSGGNEFHGSVFANYTPGFLEGPREKIRREGQVILTDTELNYIADVGFEIGGPIQKDKLWFYAGFAPSFMSYKLTRSLNKIRLVPDPDPNNPGGLIPEKDPFGFTLTDPIPGTEREFNASQTSYQYIGKLTYLFNPNHNLSLSVTGAPTYSGGDGAFGIIPQSGAIEVGNIAGTYEALAHRYISSSMNIGLKLSSAFLEKKLLFDAAVGYHHANNARLPSDGSELGTEDGLAGFSHVIFRRNNPGRHPITDFETVPDSAGCEPAGTMDAQACPVGTYNAGGPDFLSDADQDRYQGKGVLTYLLEGAGHHVVKAGADVELMSYFHKKAYSGGQRFRESPSGARFADHRQYGFLTGPDEAVIQPFQVADSDSTTFGVFVQDSWAILDKITLNAGVRYDTQIIYGADDRVGLSLPHQWSPRVGVIYDFTQQGKSKIYGNFARYYESVPLDIADRSFPGERSVLSSHVAEGPGVAGCNPLLREEQNGDCLDDQYRRPFFTNPDDPNRLWRPVGGDKVPIDPDIKPQSSDEIVVGGEYEVLPDGRAGAQFTMRYMNHVIEDMSRDEANTYFIGNPGHGIARDFPEAKRDYKAVTLYFSKVFNEQWLAEASYTFSTLEGNWAGLFRPETDQLDPNINSDFDLISLLPNRDGPLPGDKRHQLKLFGAKEWTIPGNMLATTGGSFRARSGEPTNYLGSHEIYGSDEVFILPRGSGERLPAVFSFDVHLGYGYKFSKDMMLSFGVDIFNVFNFQAATKVDETYTESSVLPIEGGNAANLGDCKSSSVNQATGQVDFAPAGCDPGKVTAPDGTTLTPEEVNPNFGNPTAYQAPRTVRLGLKLTF